MESGPKGAQASTGMHRAAQGSIGQQQQQQHDDEDEDDDDDDDDYGMSRNSYFSGWGCERPDQIVTKCEWSET